MKKGAQILLWQLHYCLRTANVLWVRDSDDIWTIMRIQLAKVLSLRVMMPSAWWVCLNVEVIAKGIEWFQQFTYVSYQSGK